MDSLHAGGPAGSRLLMQITHGLACLLEGLFLSKPSEINDEGIARTVATRSQRRKQKLSSVHRFALRMRSYKFRWDWKRLFQYLDSARNSLSGQQFITIASDQSKVGQKQRLLSFVTAGDNTGWWAPPMVLGWANILQKKTSKPAP